MRRVEAGLLRLLGGALALACAGTLEAVPEASQVGAGEQVREARPQAEPERRRRTPRPRRSEWFTPPPGGHDSLGFTPLTELLDGRYKGESGGLYGDGSNEPSEKLRLAATRQLENLVPRDRGGRPDPDGKIVMISIGMSNTHAEFMAFQRLAKKTPGLNPRLVLVDGAQGANDAGHWADPHRINPRTNIGLWERVDGVLRGARVSPEQVQVAWIKLVLAHPARYGEFPDHARELEKSIAGVLHLLKQHYPNTSLAFLSSRIYAGYSGASLSPEPYAYESAFSVRWLIERQQAGDPELNWDPAKGAVRAPLALWGPYLWADGTRARESDGLTWPRKVFNRDGVHPTPEGEDQVARLLMRFFTTDAFARPWFVGQP